MKKHFNIFLNIRGICSLIYTEVAFVCEYKKAKNFPYFTWLELVLKPLSDQQRFRKTTDTSREPKKILLPETLESHLCAKLAISQQKLTKVCEQAKLCNATDWIIQLSNM